MKTPRNKITLCVLAVFITGLFMLTVFWGRDEQKFDADETVGGSTVMQEALVKEKAEVFASSELTETYRSDLHGFSLNYPAGLETRFFQDGTTAIVAILDGATGLGVQIAISPFDEPTTNITAERVRQDIPDISINEPQDVTLGSPTPPASAGQGRGIAFIDGTGADAKRQVWFAARGHLFQLTAPMRFDATLKKMLNTWVFL